MVVAAFLPNSPLSIHFPETRTNYWKFLSKNMMAENQSDNTLATVKEDSEWDYEYHETETEVSEVE